MDAWRSNASKLFNNTSDFFNTASARIAETINTASTSLAHESAALERHMLANPSQPQQRRPTEPQRKRIVKSSMSADTERRVPMSTRNEPVSPYITINEEFFQQIRDSRKNSSNLDEEDKRERSQGQNAVDRLREIDPGLYTKLMQLVHLEELVGLMKSHFQAVSESMNKMTQSGCLLANDAALFWDSSPSHHTGKIQSYHEQCRSPYDYERLMFDVARQHKESDFSEGVHEETGEPPFDLNVYLGLWVALDQKAHENFNTVLQAEIMEEFNLWFDKLKHLKTNVGVLVQLRFKIQDSQAYMLDLTSKIEELGEDSAANLLDERLRKLERQFILLASNYEDIRDDVNQSFRILVDKRFQIMNRFVSLMADFQRGFFESAHENFSELNSSGISRSISAPETFEYMKHNSSIERSGEAGS